MNSQRYKQFYRTIYILIILLCAGISAYAQNNKNDEKAGTNNETQSSASEGVIRLRVTFLASGEIGEITVVSGQSDDLIRQAIEAARKMKFEPKLINGVATTVTKTVEFRFTIFYEEDDKN